MYHLSKAFIPDHSQLHFIQSIFVLFSPVYWLNSASTRSDWIFCEKSNLKNCWHNQHFKEQGTGICSFYLMDEASYQNTSQHHIALKKYDIRICYSDRNCLFFSISLNYNINVEYHSTSEIERGKMKSIWAVLLIFLRVSYYIFYLVMWHSRTNYLNDNFQFV